MLSKLLYLHGIYYNVIEQDPNHDALFNITNILTEKWQKIFLSSFVLFQQIECQIFWLICQDQLSTFKELVHFQQLSCDVDTLHLWIC